MQALTTVKLNLRDSASTLLWKVVSTVEQPKTISCRAHQHLAIALLTMTDNFAQSWAHDNCLALRQRNVEHQRQENSENVKDFMSKWSSRNEYGQNVQ